MKIDTAHDAIQHVKNLTDTCVLKFSGGKDSLAAWLTLRPHFKRIIPIYHYWVPDLQFVEKYLAYCEDFFGERIIRVPHPGLYDMLSSGYFQPPHAIPVIEGYDFGRATMDDYVSYVAEDLGIDSPWSAVGTKKSDSSFRRLTFSRFGCVREGKCTFFPVADMTDNGVFNMIRGAGVKLPADYQIWGRSFDGIDYRFLRHIKTIYPEDYCRITDLFPLIEAEYMRYQI